MARRKSIKLERERVQAEVRWLKSQAAKSDTPPTTTTLEPYNRDGEEVRIYPDGDRHERRIQRTTKSGHERLFWATIAVSCGAPGVERESGQVVDPVMEKKFGTLAKAHNDLDAFYQYHRPVQIGDPFIVAQPTGFGKSSGYFDTAARLDNPTSRKFRATINRTRDWIAANQDDPEYVSFQLNFCFSGHGEYSAESGATLVLADKELGAEELADLLLRCIPESDSKPNTCRLDLFLDCCHSAAIACAIDRALRERQSEVDPDERSILKIGQVFCSCLDDEESFEMNDTPHSAFTFAFLNECSRKQPDGHEAAGLGLRDVGWYTKGRQHPFLVDFTGPKPFSLRFQTPKIKSRPLAPVRYEIDMERLGRDPLGELLVVARTLRPSFQDAEWELVANPGLREPFSRKDILKLADFPFL